MSAVAWRACAQVERVQFNAAGQVALELKSSWRDGATHLVMSPPESMQRLAALVPLAQCRDNAAPSASTRQQLP